MNVSVVGQEMVMYACVCLWRPKLEVGISQSCFTSPLRQDLFTEPRALSTKLVGQRASVIHLSTCFGFIGCNYRPSCLYSKHLPLSHLSDPRNKLYRIKQTKFALGLVKYKLPSKH